MAKKYEYFFPYEKFEELAEKKGVTSYRVSKETGVSQSALSEWKSGGYVPKLDKLCKIADYFKVKIDYFVVRSKKE